VQPEPEPLTPTVSGRAIVAASIVIATGVFVFVVTRPLLWLLGVVPDDAFYYLGIARNIAMHGSSSFDGINPTNGYHPGWMFALVICARVVRGSDALLRAGLTLAFAFHVASALLLGRGLSRWMAPPWNRIVAACWLLNPVPFALAAQAMESSFYSFTLALAFLIYSRRIAPKLAAGEELRVADLGGLGAGLALCFLGRTEAAILAACVMVTVAISSARRPAPRLFNFATMGVAFLLTVAPWFAFSRFATGRWSQASGAMKMLWAAQREQTLWMRIHSCYLYLKGVWLMHPAVVLPAPRLVPHQAIISLAIIAVLVAVAVGGLRRPETRPIALLGLAALVGTFTTGIVYSTLFEDQQLWYRIQPSFVLYVFTCIVAITFASRFISQRSAGALGWVCVLYWTWVVIAHVPRLAEYPWQRDVFTSEPAFEQLVPAGEPIGALNAGIPGYFGPRTIINLDGLVNNTIAEYYTHRDFDRYLRDANIHYVADEQLSLGRSLLFARQPLDLEVMAEAPLTGWPGHRFLWRVRDRDAR